MPSAFLLFATVLAGQSDPLAEKSRVAKQLMSTGRFEQAIPIYQELVKAVPNDTGLLLNLALAQHMAGHEAESIPNFEAVLRAQPKSLPALLSLGAARLALNQPSQAIAPLRQAIEADPANRDARGMLAGACMDSGRYDEAAEQFRKLTALAVDEPRAWYGLGMAYQAIAGSAFDRLQRAGPQSPYLAALIAGARVQRRQYRSAFFFYREALKKLPDLHGVHQALADVYRKTGHPDWAESEEAKERSLAPADCRTHAGECQFLAGKDLEALRPLRTAAPSPETLYWQVKAANELAYQAFFRLGQLPPSVELHQFKAEIARNQGQPVESVSEWREALKLLPGDPRLQQELAVSLFMAGDYKAALEESLSALKKMPRSGEANLIAGDSLARLEQPDKAIPYLRAALADDSHLPGARAALGLALARSGNTAKAIPLLEESLDADDDGSLHYQLARAYQAAGESAKAAAAMAEYREILKKSQAAKDEIAREAQIEPPN